MEALEKDLDIENNFDNEFPNLTLEREKYIQSSIDKKKDEIVEKM